MPPASRTCCSLSDMVEAFKCDSPLRFDSRGMRAILMRLAQFGHTISNIDDMMNGFPGSSWLRSQLQLSRGLEGSNIS